VTFAIVRFIVFSHAWVNVLVKGGVAFLLYGLLVYLMNSSVRRAVARFFFRPSPVIPSEFRPSAEGRSNPGDAEYLIAAVGNSAEVER